MSRIVLVGCGKAKGSNPAPARDLYTGCLFRDRVRYAEAGGDPWRIVSARYGLVDPDDELSPYDQTIASLPEVDRAAWALAVALDLVSELPDLARLRSVHVELHMGADYAERLRDVLQAAGMAPSWPVQHLGIGEQRAWYAQRKRGVA